MTDLKDFGIDNNIAPKKEQKERFLIRVFNCYALVDEKTKMTIDTKIGYNNKDLLAREKIVVEKAKCVEKYGEFYEE